MKAVGLLGKLQYFNHVQASLLTIYKSFLRPHLDYGDIIYDQPLNVNLSSKLGSWKSLPAIRTRASQALDEIIIFNLQIIIPSINHSSRNPNSFTTFPFRTEYFTNSFFPCIINRSNKVDQKIPISTSYLSFTNVLINFFRPTENKIFNGHETYMIIKLQTRLQ